MSLKLDPKIRTQKRKKQHQVIQSYSVGLKRVAQAVLAVSSGPDREARQEAAILGAIWLLVTKGYGSHGDVVEINRLLPRHWWFHRPDELREVTGGCPGLFARMSKGGVIPAGGLGAWSPDLWTGLRISGALFTCHRAGTWRTAPLTNRPALRASFREPLPFRALVNDWHAKRLGKCLRLGGLWAAHLGADDPGGAGVLAGILMGARLIEHEGRTWAGVPAREAVLEVAKGLGVPFVMAGKGPQRAILFSPFWGALLAPQMPASARDWYLQWNRQKAGMCPLLPWAFLRFAWGRKFRELDDFPREVVPYLITFRGLYSHGWHLKGVQESALREFGMVGVDRRMREAWLMWMRWKGYGVEGFREGMAPVGLIDV